MEECLFSLKARREQVQAYKASSPTTRRSRHLNIDPGTLEQIEASSDGMLDLETAAMLMTDFQHKAAAAAERPSEQRRRFYPRLLPRPKLTARAIRLLLGRRLPHMPWDTSCLEGPSETKGTLDDFEHVVARYILSQAPYVHMGLDTTTPVTSTAHHGTTTTPSAHAGTKLPYAGRHFPSIWKPHTQCPLPFPVYDRTSLTGQLSPIARTQPSSDTAKGTTGG